MKQSIGLIVLCIIALGCRKKPREKNATLVIYPQHHGVARNLTNAKVYIKYNSPDAPAGNQYDDSVGCTILNGTVKGSFSQLSNGDYYIYGTAYDTSVKENVHGGMPYTISSQTEQDVTLAISE